MRKIIVLIVVLLMVWACYGQTRPVEKVKGIILDTLTTAELNALPSSVKIKGALFYDRTQEGVVNWKNDQWELLETSGGGSSDHGALTGLGDDDHPLYFTEAEGDARYLRDVAGSVGTTEILDNTIILQDLSAALVAYIDSKEDGSGDVTASTDFGNDNRLIRSDGNTKGVQASGIIIDDSDNFFMNGELSMNSNPVTGVSELAVNGTSNLGIANVSGLLTVNNNFARVNSNSSKVGWESRYFPTSNPSGQIAQLYTDKETGDLYYDFNVGVSSPLQLTNNGALVNIGTDDQTLAEVLAQGNDANGDIEEINNLRFAPLGSSTLGWEFRSQTSGNDFVLLSENSVGSNTYTPIKYKFNDSGIPTDAVDVMTKGDVDAAIAGATPPDADEVGFTPTGNTTSTNAYAAIVELQTDIDNIALSGKEIESNATGFTNGVEYTNIVGGTEAEIAARATDASRLDICTDCVEYKYIQVAASDLTTDVTTGTAKAYFRMPYAATLSEVRVSLLAAGTSTGITVDINENGTSVLSTKLTTDATEETSETASTPAVISDSSLADDAEITIDFDAVPTAGQGVIVTLKLIES